MASYDGGKKKQGFYEQRDKTKIFSTATHDSSDPHSSEEATIEYDIDWGDDTVTRSMTSSATHISYTTPGDSVSGAMLEDDEITIGSSTGSPIKHIRIYQSNEDLSKDAEKKKAEIIRLLKMMKIAEEVDLCFLVDCTGSMQPYIDQVKSNIKTWNQKLRAKYTDLQLRVAFVRYTDFDQPESTRTTWLNFTGDTAVFTSFVDSIKARAGGDTAEDVFGGLEAVVTKLEWRAFGTKVLIHIADAPCHGKQYYTGRISDDHPRGDPKGRDLRTLMSKLHRREINYHFGHIKEEATSKMIEEFNKLLLECTNSENCIHTFDATSPELLGEGIFHSVSASISASLEGLTRNTDEPKAKYKTMIQLDKMMPNWDEILPHRVKVSRQTTGTSVHLPSVTTVIKKARYPFAHGSMRAVYHSYFPNEEKHVVLKEFIKQYKGNEILKRHMQITRIMSTASFYAEQFNAERPPSLGVCLKIIESGLIEWPCDGGKVKIFSYEPYITGSYKKFNSNIGYVAPGTDPFSETCQAFSHYTWVKSNKRLVVCDIQGVKKSREVLITDPAIHDKNILLYGSTNLGAFGIRRFFESHVCNEICTQMRLVKPVPPHRSTSLQGRHNFEIVTLPS